MLLRDSLHFLNQKGIVVPPTHMAHMIIKSLVPPPGCLLFLFVSFLPASDKAGVGILHYMTLSAVFQEARLLATSLVCSL